MHYYKFNIGDFDKSTRHLSIIERGLFRDILDLYVKDEKPITDNLKKLERLLCVKSKAEKEALQNILDDFFVLTDDGYYSDYCQSILDDTTDRVEASRENGKKGGRPSKQSQSETKANGKQDESQSKPSENLEKTQDKPSNNLGESYPSTQLPNYPSTHNPNTQTPPNPQSGVCVGETADAFLEKAEQVKQANAQDIQNWVAPKLDEIRSMLFSAGFVGSLTEQQYNQLTSDFKVYYADQAIIGKPIVTDSLRKNKLRDWVMRNAQKKPSYQKKSSQTNEQRFGTKDDPLAVDVVWNQPVAPVSQMTYEEWEAEEKAKQAARASVKTKGFEVIE